MLRDVLLGLLRPSHNRFYVGRRRAAVLYAAALIPSLLMVALGAWIYPSWIWTAVAIGIVVLGVIQFMTISKWVERFLWNHLFKRFYGSSPPDDPDMRTAMKAFERNPGPTESQRIKQLLKENK